MKEDRRFKKEQEIRQKLEGREETLLSKYEGAFQKLKIKCKNGHEYECTWANLQVRPRCAVCSGKARITPERARTEFTARGLTPTFKDEDLVGAFSKLSFRCFCGYEGTLQYNNFQQGAGCYSCGRKSSAEKKIAGCNVDDRLNDLLKARKFDLVSCEHETKQVTSKLHLCCTRCKHEWETTLNYLENQPHGCSHCSGLVQLTFSGLVEEIKKEEYSVLKDTIDSFNNRTVVPVKCDKGHDYETNGQKWHAGYRCPYCAQKKLTTEMVTEIFDKEGYKFFGAYKKSTEKIALRCRKGHLWETSWRAFRHDGVRCPTCREPYTSAQEREIYRLIRKWLPTENIQRNTRKIIHPFELDIALPDRKMAIEFNGEYWHSEAILPKEYHVKKRARAEGKGYKVLFIWGHEWASRKVAVQSRLKALLGCNTVRIGARNTTIVRVKNKRAREFLDKFHLQGHAKFIIAFGLYLDKKLCAIMTFNRHHRNNCPDLVLNRFCVRKNHSISGGASKLLKTAVDWIRNNTEFQRIVSFSDNRWSDGDLYKQLGFVLDESASGKQLARPDYFYIKGKHVFSKQSLKKTDKEKLSGKTEHELRLKQGYLRVYDCGKQRWIYTIV